MKAVYWQRGETLDYTSEEDVSPGGLVSFGTRIGVAAAGIAAGETGTVQMEGVFSLTKAEGEAISLGAAVYYDQAADVITATAEGNVPTGYAAAAAAEIDSAVLVKLPG